VTDRIQSDALIDSEQLQKAHYDRIAKEYEAHYNDACSQQYRVKFQYEPMFAGIELAGNRVLEAMCGSGHTTQYLLSKGAYVTGLDISPQEIKSFRQHWPKCDAICASALDSNLESSSFDCIVISGGLHHVHPHLNEVVREMHRILKPRGYFCFVEPHAGSLPDVIRKQWYKHDHLFANNEAAIDVKALKKEFASSFDFNFEKYLGSVGYLFVLNSMVFRIPLSLKPIYTPLMLKLESLFGKVQGELLSCVVVAQWQKK
jgi:SAM-dependent methyltransferase